jgi:putative membrane protein
VGDLAQKNGGSDDVKSFGKMLVDDHTASNTKTTSLAQSNGVTPPTEPKAADKQKHDELAKLSGAEFDREFAKAMVKGHEEAISKFEAASKGDDDIAKFAQETLPKLQRHQKLPSLNPRWHHLAHLRPKLPHQLRLRLSPRRLRSPKKWQQCQAMQSA